MPPKINPDYCYYPLRLVKSPIHRWGVVAEKNIPQGRYVIEYTGRLLNRKQHREVTRKRRRVYTYQLDAYWTLDGAVNGSGAERVNHSCDPNLYAQYIGKRVFFWALRRIKKGEELTVDYCFEPDERHPTLCNCGSKKCRGTINKPHEPKRKRTT